MTNAVRSDRDFGEASRVDATGYPSSRRRVEDRVLEQYAHVSRHQSVQEVIDPPGMRLPRDIISEMEAGLKQQVDRLVAERH